MARKKADTANLGVDAARLSAAPNPMEKSLRVRASQAEHDEMVATAKSYGLTLSEYFRQLHRQAVAAANERRSKK